MAILIEPEHQHRRTTDPEAIGAFLRARGIWFDQWEAEAILEADATQEEVLEAYQSSLAPFMAQRGYQTADVIVVNPDTPNLTAIRQKFLAEHTHSEDEVRFFVEGRGHFWFHIESNTPNTSDEGGKDSTEEVFCLTCEAGDLISVPAGAKHWFDLGDPAHVKAIRIFIDAAGWVPHYTDSGMDGRYTREPATASIGTLPNP